MAFLSACSVLVPPVPLVLVKSKLVVSVTTVTALAAPVAVAVSVSPIGRCGFGSGIDHGGGDTGPRSLMAERRSSSVAPSLKRHRLIGAGSDLEGKGP